MTLRIIITSIELDYSVKLIILLARIYAMLPTALFLTNLEMIGKCVETWLKIIQKQNMPSNFQPYLKTPTIPSS